jgi:hypothetical protein
VGRDNLPPLAAYAALALYHMREALLQGRVYFQRDVHLQWHGQMESFVKAVSEGSWPLWDPWPGFGQPMLANPNNQLLYPLTWLNLLMVPPTYYKLYVFVHLVLGGWGTWRLARRFGLGPAPALLAGGAFLLSGPLLSLANVWNHLAGAALLPWLVLAALRLAEAPGARTVVAAAFAFAAPFLAGSPDFALLGLPLAAALAWWRARLCGTQHGRLLRAALVALAAGACVSAAQALPALELASRSARAALPSGQREHWSLHPLAAAQVALPLTPDWAPIPLEWRAVLFEGREPYLFSIYLGVPLLLLAALGAGRQPRFPCAILLATAGLALLWSLGRFTPFHGLTAQLLPPLGAVRFPVKGMLLCALSTALLAGRGLDALRDRPRRGTGAALLIVGLLVALAARAVPQGPWAFMGAPIADVGLLVGAAGALLLPGRSGLARTALLLIALGDLARVHRHLNPTAPGDFYRSRPAVVADVAHGDLGRFLVLDYTARPDWPQRYLGRPRPYMVAAPDDPRERWRAAMGLRLYPVAPLLAGWRVPASYSRDLLGLAPPALVTLNDVLDASFPSPVFVRLLELGGVTRLAALHELGLPGLEPTRRVRGPFFEDIRLYALPGGLPRAYVAAAAAQRPSLEALLDPDLDLDAVALIEDAPASADAVHGRARIEVFRSDFVRVGVESDAPAHLVLIDAWDPGWRARVDGAPAPVRRANLAFRAVPVPAGRHVVEMRYWPVAVPLGLLVSAVALMGCLAAALRAGPRGAGGGAPAD